jgi:hypothetical protein
MEILLLVIIVQIAALTIAFIIAENCKRDAKKRLEEILKCQRNAQHETIDLLYKIYREK